MLLFKDSIPIVKAILPLIIYNYRFLRLTHSNLKWPVKYVPLKYNGLPRAFEMSMEQGTQTFQIATDPRDNFFNVQGVAHS